MPITIITYAIVGVLPFKMLEKNMNKALTAGVSNIAATVVWNTLNYFAYSTIKNEYDEKFIKGVMDRARALVRGFVAKSGKF